MRIRPDVHAIRPGKRPVLNKALANDRSGFHGDKEQAKALFAALTKRIGQLQELLYAGHQHKVLIVLQGMDTAGKDGTIRDLCVDAGPQNVRVAAFKVPTLLELDHDFLWRVHQPMPGKGELVFFNRSHYEDVVTTRVHGLIPPKRCLRRCGHINDFERMLVDEGTMILKFFLHIDKDEQWARLKERQEQPDKRWKFHPEDLKERKHWDEYMDAYADAISRTSTRWAPWYVIPANKKWYRNLLVAQTVVRRLVRFPRTRHLGSKDLLPRRLGRLPAPSADGQPS